MKLILPDEVKTIIETLTEAGFEAYAVGGAVRDSLLRRTPGDWDVTTSAKPAEVKALFKNTIDTGIAHGTVTVRLHRRSFEVTTYRIDGAYADNRHPESVTFTGALKEDLLRRDFTINAMAYNDTDGLVDLFGGQIDLENRIIRAVGDPYARFTEDALRIMRCVRFAAQLGFSIEKETYSAAKALAHTVKNISRERVREELVKILMSGHPEDVLVLQDIGVLQDILPEFSEMIGCEQHTPFHCMDVASHTVEVLKNIPEDRILRIAALLHDTGKPAVKRTAEDGRDHFKGHEAAGEKIAFLRMSELKFDNDTRDRVCRLIRFHGERALWAEPDRNAVRHIMAAYGKKDFDKLLVLMKADASGKAEKAKLASIASLDSAEACYREILSNGECTAVSELGLKGNDLIALGLKPGKAMGEILNGLLEIVLDAPELNTKEKLIEIVHEKFIDQNLQFFDKHDKVK